MAATLKGKAPGSGAGEMSRRTARLRPTIQLSPAEIRTARTMRRAGSEPEAIAQALGASLDQVERALLQMRSARPETTRGTLNVTLKAHRFVMAERQGDEPLWQTMDRIFDELIRLRQVVAKAPAAPAKPRREAARPDDLLPGLLPEPGPH